MPLTLSIREVLPVTPRARLVRLDLNGLAFDYAAGQAVLVGVPGTEKRKPYSIACAPEDTRHGGYVELLVGVDGDGRAGPHLPLDAGVEVEIDGPFGSFTFRDDPDASNFLFIAGGTGIAPLRSMLRHAILLGGNRRIGLLYSARTRDEFAFEDEFRALAANGTIELRLRVTRESDHDWPGARGRVDQEALAELVHVARTMCFICGPAAMVDEVPRLLSNMGMPRGRIRIEEW